MIKLRVGLGFMSFIFAIYGIREMKEALEDGRSLRDGIEALAICALLVGVLLLLNKFMANRREDPTDLL